MSDLPPGTVEAPGAVNLSTTLKDGTYDTAFGTGQMSVSEEKPADPPAKPETLRDVLNDEVRKQDEEAAKARADADVAKKESDAKKDDKAKPEAKPKEDEKKADPEPAPKEPVKDAAAEKPGKEAVGRRDEAQPSSEDGKPSEPPARLLPKAREVWGNVPREVKGEFARMEREHAAEIEAHREAKAFADEVQPYRDMAKQAGTTVKAALDRYVHFDQAIAQDFGRGMRAIAEDRGQNAVQAVTSLLRAYGATPQQFAETVMKNPQAWQAQAAPAPQAQHQPRVDPAVQHALQEVAALKQQLQQQAVTNQIIAPFAAQHPRFEELYDDIVKVLNSGMVPESLSPAERLEVAYDMAERLFPPPVAAPRAFESPASPPADAPQDAGRKSVRGAPSDGAMPETEDNTPLRDWLRKELRKTAG